MMRVVARVLCVFLSSLFGSAVAFGQSSLLIWPIDPTIEYDQKGTALWLENNGSAPIRVQARVLAWHQEAGAEVYAEQEAVIVSPPAAEIQVGQRQLLRLVRIQTVAANTEHAYRVLIDEIPRPEFEAVSSPPGLISPGSRIGLALQMRYSVPLFVSGEGVWTRQDYQKPRDMSKATQPQLTFRLESHQGGQWLVLVNDGPVHARLSSVFYRQGTRAVWEVPGLLGYVLAHSETRFRLPQRVGGGVLSAKMNASVDERVIPPR